METQAVHDLRLRINQVRNTIKRSEHREAIYKRISYGQEQRLEEIHPLLKAANEKLKYAVYWLGKSLAYNGSTENLVYNTDETKKGIDHEHVKDENELLIVRAELNKIIDEVVAEPKEGAGKPSRELAICRTQIFIYLTEARFAIGELMGKLEKEAEDKLKKEQEEKNDESATGEKA